MKQLLVGAGSLLCGASLMAQAPVEAESVELKLKFTPGKKLKQDMDMNMDMNVAVQGQQQQMKMSQKISMGMNLSKHEKGTKVDMQFLRMAMSMTAAGVPMMNFDSDVDKDGPQAQMFAPLLKGKMHAIIKDGKVVEFKGVDANAMMKQAGLDDKMMLNQMQQQMGMLPKGPVKVGQEWKNEVKMPMANVGADIKMTVNMKLLSLEKVGGRSLANLSMSAKFKGDINQQGMNMTLETSKFVGTLQLDRDLGQFTLSKIEMNFTMTPQGELANMMGKTTAKMKMTQTVSEIN